MPTTHVAAAIITDGNAVLACQRGYGDMKDGWEFPGGKVKPGETSQQACRREIEEELGCRLGMVWLFSTVEHDYPDFHLSMDCFVCTLAPGSEPTMLEHEDMRWLGLGQLDSVDWLPADRDLVRDIGLAWNQIFSPEHL
jgi:8-oxo-dGTP diphosphatase